MAGPSGPAAGRWPETGEAIPGAGATQNVSGMLLNEPSGEQNIYFYTVYLTVARRDLRMPRRFGGSFVRIVLAERHRIRRRHCPTWDYSKHNQIIM